MVRYFKDEVKYRLLFCREIIDWDLVIAVVTIQIAVSHMLDQGILLQKVLVFKISSTLSY